MATAMPTFPDLDRVLREVESAAEEIVDFAAELIRLPTVNPPGEAYEVCARLIGDRLTAGGFEVEYLTAGDRRSTRRRIPA